MPLGEHLLAERICTQAQLDKALNAQVVYGGRLGTVLLEQGAIDLRMLAKALGKTHHVRAFDPMQPIKIPEEILRLVPARLAVQHQLVPLSMEGRRLYVLILDPTNRRGLESVSLATGREVVPVVLPEVRLRILLERYYGAQQDIRYLTLAKKLAENGGRVPPPAPAKPAADPSSSGDLMPEEVFQAQVSEMAHKQEGASAPAQGIQVVDRERLAADEGAEVLDVSEEDIIPIEEGEGEDWAVFMEKGAAQPVDLAAAAGSEEEELIEEAAPDFSPVDLAKASALLEAAASRDDIAHAALRLARTSFGRAALFIVREGRASGWDAFGEGINLPLLKSLLISLQQPSVFQLVYETKAHFLGKVPKGEVNMAFLQLLGGDPPKSVFLYPLLFRGRVVNLIYGDGGPGKNAPVDVSDLLILGPKIPQTFERILRERRRPTAGPKT